MKLIAIVGRPNVGKSLLFNTLVGKRVSIVDDEAGVTRDRIIETAEWRNVKFNLVDTGGIDFDDKNAFNVHIREQVDIAIDLADAIIFLVDGKAGVTANDHEIATLLRKTKKPVILAVNKLDNNEKRDNVLYDFYKLKIGTPIGISCTQKLGLGDLLDAVFNPLTGMEPKDGEDEQRTPRIAIVGKPNAGKSSIINKLLGEKRVMVSEIAGTTRDTVDSTLRFEGRDYILTDTAGIRRKRSIEVQTIEHYSVIRALASIRNSDIVVLVVDASEGLTEQDVRLLGYADEQGKPSVLCINKWDLIEKDTHTMNAFKKKLNIDLAFMMYYKSIFISALTGQRIGEIMKAVEFVLERAQTRISTGQLNTLISGFVATTPPPMHAGKRPKFLYSTQVGVEPPTFALFINDKTLVKSSYLRYLENNLRKSIDLTGTPIRFLLRDRDEK
ncbi:MAG: ribosome biogenesis GTPase Der [Firmicutes bacterium]|nr:ribosome biogenesis GTPase Der [Bacillota bacterium]